MLKKGFRIRKKEDFERVFRKGKPLFFGAIACKVIPGTEKHFRLGFSLSKKHLIRATDRNRLRRVISEPFSIYVASGKSFPAVDLVFFTVKRVDSDQMGSLVASMTRSVVEYINQ